MGVRVLVAALAAAVAVGACNPEQAFTRYRYGDAVARISADLTDPDHAMYRGLSAHYSTAGGLRVRSVCGEVNLRNMSGGYNGYQRFVYVQEVAGAPSVMVDGLEFRAGEHRVSEPFSPAPSWHTVLCTGPDRPPS